MPGPPWRRVRFCTRVICDACLGSGGSGGLPDVRTRSWEATSRVQRASSIRPSGYPVCDGWRTKDRRGDGNLMGPGGLSYYVQGGVARKLQRGTPTLADSPCLTRESCGCRTRRGGCHLL